MMEVYKCSMCDLQFRTIEQLPGRWRLRRHERINHLAKCEKCDKTFASYTHATVHLYQTHNVRCVQCGQECDGLCLMDTVKKLKGADSDEKEKMLHKIEKRIETEENSYLNSFRDVSERHMMQLRVIARALDEGYTGCMANSWGMLSYLPFMEVSPKLGVLTRFGQELVMRHQYLSALVKMNQYLIYRGNLSTVITNYVNDCMQLNNENETFELMPEMLANTQYCFPERLIGGPETDQWTDSMYAERYGVINRSPMEEELLPVHNNLSYPWEAYASDAVNKVAEPDTKLKVQEKAIEVQRANAIYEKQWIYLSDYNAADKYTRVKEMRDLDGKNGAQQEVKTVNKKSNRMDHNYTNVDLVAKDYGTHVPSGEIVKEALQKEINDDVPTSAKEGLSLNKDSTLEKRLKSVNICKEVGSGDITRNGVTTSKDTAGNTNARREDTEDEHGAESDLKSGKTNRVSIRMETCDSPEVVNEADAMKSTSFTSLDAGDPRTEDSNAKSINKDLNYAQLSSRENNKNIIIPLTEGNNHVNGKAAVVNEVKGVIINNDNTFAFETFLEEDNLDDWFFKAESSSLMEESDNFSFIIPSTEGNNHVTEKTTVINEVEGVIINNNNTFAFETFSEEDNLDDWLFKAEKTSLMEKSDNFSTTACDIEKIRLEVKENNFVSANGIEIKKNTDISTDIRTLLNHLVSKEQVTESDRDKSNTKGRIKAACKTNLKVVNSEESNTEKGININDEDMVKDCHKGHPELSPTNLGMLRLCDDPKPRFVKEGSKVLILGRAWIGEKTHWLQGEIKDALEPITITNKNITMAKCMTIHNPLLINHWGEICSIKIEKPISVMIDKVLIEDLELITMGQDLEISGKPSASTNLNVKEKHIIEGLELEFSEIDLHRELDEARDMLTESGMKIELVLKIEALPHGKGFVTIDNNSEEEKQLKDKTIPAEITIIIEKKDNGEIEITHGFLNGVQRRITFDSCSNSSFIINTKNPKKNRRFKIMKSSKSYMSREPDFTDIYYSEDEDDDESDSDTDYKEWIIHEFKSMKELPMPGLEVRFSLKDILAGLRQCEDVLNNDSNTVMVTFMMRIGGPGTGVLPASCTELRANTKTISGKLSLVLSKYENGNIEISRCFFNGVRREMSVEFESLRSIIFITEKPWRSRWFSIKNREGNDDNLEEDSNTDIEEDSIEVDDGTNTNNDEKLDLHIKRKNGQYFIYRPAMKTWREATSLNNSLIGKNKLYTIRSDDPRKGGKVKNNEDQEDILGEESFYNKVYHEVANLSNSVMSVFQPLKKTLGRMSESINEVLHFKEESQLENTRREKEMSTRELKREINRSQSEVKDNLSQPYVKSKVKLRNNNKFEPLSLFGLILISTLLGTAGAGKISSKDNNEIHMTGTMTNPMNGGLQL